jgi:CRISPR/Cas system-associated exonuclease Cas4 (RecB family)
MNLPNGFLFNQSNLQDYVDCQRRFYLRYVLHQAWPAVEAEPFLEYERLMDQGSLFHKIVRQHLTGVPESQIEESLGNDDVMAVWWRNYKHSLKTGILERILPGAKNHYEELTLSTPVAEFRLIAKYDLLIIRPDGKLVILDWKTSQNHPKRKWLADRLQTHVYPFVLTHAAAAITNGNQVDSGHIEMIYWFTNYPDQPEQFNYNGLEYDSDANYLGNLILTIDQNSEQIFSLTSDLKRCLFCAYRSLCNRGVKPGELHQLEEWQESGISSENVTLDYEQIGEIEF